jgi:cytochrome c
MSNLEANNPDALGIDLIAEGLVEPLGVKVVEGRIYILQDHEISQLNEQTGEFTTISTGWFVNMEDNWTMDLEFKDGYFHFTTGAWNYSNEPTRGCWMRASLEGASNPDGNFECMAGGLRSTNGMIIGPEGEFFTGDNQGNWNPSNRLWNLKPGRYYGFETNTGNPFYGKERSLAVAYVPHNTAANSLGGGVFIEEGLFAGQMLVGDITKGGIKRYFLERMNGEYQSCVFRFCDGVLDGIENGANILEGELDAGVNRLKFGPDGALYVAQLGAGLGTQPGGFATNWSWQRTWTGLQKLVHNGQTVFEMLAVRSKENGFEIEFTKPVGSGAESASSYQLRSWHNTPVEDYGGGANQDNHALTVMAATVSQDKMKVMLEVDPLSFLPEDGWEQKASVIYITLNNLKSQAGEDPWTQEAWYSLNFIGPADVSGCMDENYQEYNPDAVYDDGIQCRTPVAVHDRNMAPHFNFSSTENDGVIITIPSAGLYDLGLKNLRGKTVKTIRGTGPAQHRFRPGAFPQGIYILEAEIDGIRHARRLFL